jgi:His-Xaa-Ser system radical SAM maturase HxsB
MSSSPLSLSIDETRILPYATEPITPDKILVTGYFGRWTFLSPAELQLLREERIYDDRKLYEKLRDAGLIVNGENANDIATLYTHLHRNLFYAPSLHMIVATNMCNFRCRYCQAGVSQGSKMMSLETADKVLDFIFACAGPYATIEFQGGECLLNWKVMRHMIEKARERNQDGTRDLHICMVSNLSLMDEEKLDFLIKHNVSICTSVDGTEAIHNANRRFATGGDTYQKTMEIVAFIKETFRKRRVATKVDMLATITKTSLKDPKGIIDAYVAFGTRTIHLRPVQSYGDALKVWDNLTYTAEEFFEFWKEAMEYIIELNKQGIDLMERGAYNILCKVLACRDPLYVEMTSPSGLGRVSLLYHWDGTIFSSDEGRMIPENIFQIGTVDQSPEEVLSSEENNNTWASTFMDLVAYHSAFRPWGGIHPVHTYQAQHSIIPNVSRSKTFKIYTMQCKYLFEKIAENGYAKELFMKWTNRIVK